MSVAGTYTYRRVFHDERPLELRADGSVGRGASSVEHSWAFDGCLLEISGDNGVICRLKRDRDGVFRGRWTQFERMPIELAPIAFDLGRMPGMEVADPFPVGPGFWWVTFGQLLETTQRLCRQLPPLRAVAGIPRAGVFVASIIAQEQNIPLVDIDDALPSSPIVPPQRRANAATEGPILIVDDTVATGRLLNWCRERARGRPEYLFAAPFVYGKCRHLVDFYASDHPYCNQAFEWSLLHEITHTSRALVDMDGVLCHDYPGTDEEGAPDDYQRHLDEALPLRPATAPLLGIVTGRMHIHRESTERWLRRHGVQYSQLHMLPAATNAERERIGHAEFKAAVYAQSDAVVFIESDSRQAERIHQLTGKPVIDFSTKRGYGTL